MTLKQIFKLWTSHKIFLKALKIFDNNLEKLSSFVDDPSMSSRTVYDFEWNDEAKNDDKSTGFCRSTHFNLALKKMNLIRI